MLAAVEVVWSLGKQFLLHTLKISMRQQPGVRDEALDVVLMFAEHCISPCSCRKPTSCRPAPLHAPWLPTSLHLPLSNLTLISAWGEEHPMCHQAQPCFQVDAQAQGCRGQLSAAGQNQHPRVLHPHGNVFSTCTLSPAPTQHSAGLWGCAVCDSGSERSVTARLCLALLLPTFQQSAALPAASIEGTKAATKLREMLL